MHPAEASHGDLGMLTANDAVLALSGSGNTNEILTLLLLIKRIGVPLIAMTGNLQSTQPKVLIYILMSALKRKHAHLVLRRHPAQQQP